MTKFPIKPAILALLLASFLAISAHAQDPSPESALPPADTGREASFLPPPAFDETKSAPAPSQIVPPALITTVPAPAGSALPVTTTAAPAPLIITPPVVTYSASPSPSPVAGAPASAATPPVAPATAAAPVAQPLDLGKPVEEGKLSDINPESIGLYSGSEGGLGAGMWKGTQRDLVERLLPTLALPSSSPLLNNLAQRFLLTTADVPAGKPGDGQSLISMRVNNLISMGDTKDAWNLIALAKPEQIDDATMRRAVEFMLISGQKGDICAKLPDITKAHPRIDLQEMLLVCQLVAKDTKAAQLTLDLMHSQDVKNDTLYYIAERNVIGGAKELPRQLTPLKPLTLALLQLTDLPLRSEVYAHPDAALIPTLLQMKIKDDAVRLSFAERAGEHGFITPADLEAVYASIVYPPEAIAGAANSTEAGSRLHALLYQAAVQEKASEKRIALSIKFLQGATASELNGAQGRVLADMIGAISPAESYNTVSASVAHIYIVANNPKSALEWLKQAHHAAIGMPGVGEELHNLWPLAVLTGLETDTDYGQTLGKWLDASLKPADPKDDGRAQRERAGAVLLLLDAAGFAVPEEDWVKIINPPVAERHTVPSAILLERLRAASTSGRRGESVLFSLLLSGSSTDESSMLSTLAIVRALRLSGLTADASQLARESVALILTPVPGKP